MIFPQKADNPFGDRIHRNHAAVNIYGRLCQRKGRGSLEVRVADGSEGEGRARDSGRVLAW